MNQKDIYDDFKLKKTLSLQGFHKKISALRVKYLSKSQTPHDGLSVDPVLTL